jgi:homocysteine S-methyltransferase
MTELNSNSPELIISVHDSYIKSGADIITTNTFRTNPSSLSEAGISNAAPYVKQAVNLAKEAAKMKQVYIAGSNAPAEDCYQKFRKLSYKKLEDNHKKHIDLLINNKVHFILNETQSHFDEIKIICSYCNSKGIPFVISLFVDEKLNILSGESVNYVIRYVSEHKPLAIGFNCIAPALFYRLIGKTDMKFNWGFYLNCGSGSNYSAGIECALDSKEYLGIVRKGLNFNPSFIGACCGSKPEHIKEIKRFFDGKNS